MSRIGKKPIAIPKGVKVSVEKDKVAVEGPKGKLSLNLHPRISVEVKEENVFVKRASDEKIDRALHGTTRALIANLIKGVTEGYSKELEIQGVGYKAVIQGKSLVLNLGFTHAVNYPIPEGITIETPKPTQVVIKGTDKAKVGEVAAQIRKIRKPEPYKGKGIRYLGEYVRRKVGKKVG